LSGYEMQKCSDAEYLLLDNVEGSHAEQDHISLKKGEYIVQV